MHLKPENSSPPERDQAQIYCFFFHNNELLMQNVESPRLPLLLYQSVKDKLSRERFLGNLDGYPCLTAIWKDPSLPDGYKSYPLRQLFNKLDAQLLNLAGRAFHLVQWDQISQFCGQCGSPTESLADPIAKTCLTCGGMVFPRLSPAVIVAVVKEREILLARATRFPNGFYSVIAGFVEPGETLEECVRREVREEVGIEVCNIRYFGSQPWPFPDSLMIAFTAEYAGGDLVIDGTEIASAAWYRPDELPQIPDRYSIARQLIDWFVENYRS